MPGNNHVRMVRVIQYFGTREWLAETMARSLTRLSTVNGTITELVRIEDHKPDPAPQGAAASDPQPTSA